MSGNVSCNTEANLRFAGTQVGTDMARLNWNGWNVHIGSMVGYVDAICTLVMMVCAVVIFAAAARRWALVLSGKVALTPDLVEA